MRLDEVSLVKPRWNDRGVDFFWLHHQQDIVAFIWAGLSPVVSGCPLGNQDMQLGPRTQNQENLGCPRVSSGFHQATYRWAGTSMCHKYSMWLSETTGTGAESCEISWCPGSIMGFSKVSWRPLYILEAATGLQSSAQGCTGSDGPLGLFDHFLIKLAKIKINEECANTE